MTAAANAAEDEPSLEDQLKAKLAARVHTIPGTSTEFLIAGWLQADGIAHEKRQDGDEQHAFFASAIPFGDADRDYRFSIRQSTIHWISRSPTRAGPVWTHLEANLFPLDGTTDLTLNQLYVRWDDHALAGKTYSTFMDDDALPSTLEYNGPGGVTYVRQWLARGSVTLGDFTLDGAVEEPQADLNAGGGSVTTDAHRPDLVARGRYEWERGHVQVAGLSRRMAVNEHHVSGSGVALSGSVGLLEDDAVLFHAATGEGIGRYFDDPISATGLTLDDGQLRTVRMTGATLYYQRRWAPRWTTFAGASTLRVGDAGRRPADSLESIVYASANLIFLATPAIRLGGEVLWGEAERVGGEGSTNLRLQLSVR